MSSKLDLDNKIESIANSAADLQQTFNTFRARQTEGDGTVPPEDKVKLRQRLRALDAVLNQQLAKDYGVDMTDSAAWYRWLKSYQPFHWFIEFHGIINSGGFDVIVGNPPYVEYSKIRESYAIKSYETESCGNLYAFVMERCDQLVSEGSRTGLIVPHSISATYRSKPLQRIVVSRYAGHYSYFSRRPGKLFDGADQCLCIFIGWRVDRPKVNFSTAYYRWYTEGRKEIFQNISYTLNSSLALLNRFQVLPKLGSTMDSELLNRISKQKPLGHLITKRGYPFYCHRISRYFIKSTDFVPYFHSERDGEKRSDDFKQYFTESELQSSIVICALNSSLFYWYWRVMFDGYHCGGDNIRAFPFSIDNMSIECRAALTELAEKLRASFRENSQRKVVMYKKTGRVSYDEFNVSKSKDILDNVDRILAGHYELKPDEVDYIINFEVKFRMSGENGDEGE